MLTERAIMNQMARAMGTCDSHSSLMPPSRFSRKDSTPMSVPTPTLPQPNTYPCQTCQGTGEVIRRDTWQSPYMDSPVTTCWHEGCPDCDQGREIAADYARCVEAEREL
jgi:hypothetical protein